MQRILNQSIFNRKVILLGLFILILLAPLFLSDFRLNLLGKFLAFAILVIGLDLLWGYTGVLSLGHGIFFGFGAYAMAMYLKLNASGGKLPDFMQWSGMQELPFLWLPFQNPMLAIFLGIFIPFTIALFLGFLTFRNRINGVYFTILSQALVVVVVTLFVGNQSITGGTNGLTGFEDIFGFSLASSSTQVGIYLITAIVLVLVYLGCKKLVDGRLGQVLIGIRDGENRLRFLGYDPSVFKTFIYAVSAGIAGVAGMLFVLQVGIISPTMMGIIPSIEMVLWVALGGRGTLIGPILGAVIVNGAKTAFSESYPDIWLYFLGLMFVVVVVFMPKGLMGVFNTLKERWSPVYVSKPDSARVEKHYS